MEAPSYKDIPGGGTLQAGIPLVQRLPKDAGRAKERLLRGIERSKDSWSHPQVAVKKLDLGGMGFKPTRLAIPIPGEGLGATSWRAGSLHAHKQGPVFLVHKDRSTPDSLAGVMSHLDEALPALKKRLSTHAPVAREKTAMKKTAATRGLYHGKPSGTDTVKFKRDYQGISINIERPRGFVMLGTDRRTGKPWSRRYRYDYGHIPKTLGGDGDGLDVFIGPQKKAEHAYWAVQRKDDGSFDEYKVFLGFDSRDEAAAVYRRHIPKKLLAGLVTMRVEMMKAMLGKNPAQHLKTAAARLTQALLERAQ